MSKNQIKSALQIALNQHVGNSQNAGKQFYAALEITEAYDNHNGTWTICTSDNWVYNSVICVLSL
mgnify:CR=1 FL=1